jgi:ectoine hydroxylase-related dioxygenase (phytanoyl-CoA dioxygenase family)
MIGGQYLEPLPPYFEQSRSAIAGDFSRSLCSTYLGSQGGFMEVVAFTRDWIPDPHAVYGKLHYDRRHQLKLILYLNDVDESNGAFGCIPASHKLGRDLFLDGWRRTLQLETTNALEIESAAAATEEDRPEYRLVPCVLANDAPIGAFVPGRDKLAIAGMAGTLIIFDTHLLHYGGFVTTPNKERWTLKGHTFAQRPLSN